MAGTMVGGGMAGGAAACVAIMPDGMACAGMEMMLDGMVCGVVCAGMAGMLDVMMARAGTAGMLGGMVCGIVCSMLAFAAAGAGALLEAPCKVGAPAMSERPRWSRLGYVRQPLIQSEPAATSEEQNNRKGPKSI